MFVLVLSVTTCGTHNSQEQTNIRNEKIIVKIPIQTNRSQVNSDINKVINNTFQMFTLRECA